MKYTNILRVKNHKSKVLILGGGNKVFLFTLPSLAQRISVTPHTEYFKSRWARV